MASASLSSAGSKPRARMAAMTSCLVGIALAAGVTFPCAHRHALVGDALRLAPGRQRGEESSKDMGRVSASVPAHFFEVDGINAAGDLPGLVEPALEAEVAHAAALEARGPELGRAMQDPAAVIADGPARRAAEVEGEDR